MVLIEDSRQQKGQHENIARYCAAHGIEVRRMKLDTGDYILPPAVSIDTKQGMGEVYNNLVQDHDRFRAECIRAQEAGTQLIILVENDDGIRSIDDVEMWHNPRIDAYYEKYAFALSARKYGRSDVKIPAPPMPSKRIARIMETMTERYGVRWAFCGYEETGAKVVELLSGEHKLPFL